MKANRIDAVFHNAVGESWVLTFATRAIRQLAEMYADAGALGMARFWAGVHRRCGGTA